MNLETLLEWDSKKFNQLSEVQLIELCKPFWNITRPLLAKENNIKTHKPSAPKPLSIEDKIKQEKMKMAKELIAKMGIKI